MQTLLQKTLFAGQAPKGFLAAAMLTELKKKRAKTERDRQTLKLLQFDTLTDKQKANLSKKLTDLTLLSKGDANPKTAKEIAGFEFKNFIMHLTPSNFSGFNVCPFASDGCRSTCLNGAGRGLFDETQLGRLRKTLFFVHFRSQFLMQLHRELTLIEKNAKGVKVVVRLNGTSDIVWESLKVVDGKSLIELHPNILFYDYTKIPARLARIAAYPNYKLTFSASENNWIDCLYALNKGVNVAVVFSQVPNVFEGFATIDGDKHDYRFVDGTGIDGKGLIVALKAKGPAKKDKSGFVKRPEQSACASKQAA